MKRILTAALILPALLQAQPYRQPNAAEIELKLQKLNFLGSVLYVAAHPDDENTLMITALANGYRATTAYLSMTRGDGGQNLIGSEIRDLLGLIRTQELLAARRIDGGEQFFTRAVDFGYSKSPEETFEIWNKDEILSDVVRVFRQYQPDVVITRFPTNGYGGHGHHTASAILAGEAFELSADPQAYPEQVKKFGTWQPRRLYTNTGRWWNQNINENTPGVVVMDVGGYDPLLGKSYAEVAALSASQHKSQGWGRRGERGAQIEYLEYRAGDQAKNDIFEGINTSWWRVKGGDRVQPLIDKVIEEFAPAQPHLSVPGLLEIRKQILSLEDGVWKGRKLQDTEQLIQDCLGLFLEVTASHHQVSPGEPVRFSAEMVNRSPVPLRMERISVTSLEWDTVYNGSLHENEEYRVVTTAGVSKNASFSEPYWLQRPHSVGRFDLPSEEWIGLPENPPAIKFSFVVNISGQQFTISRPLIYKWVDPVKGELWRPVEIVPAISVEPTEMVMVFKDQSPKDVAITLRSSVDRSLRGMLSLSMPVGWKSAPAQVSFELSGRGTTAVKTFTIIPPETESVGEVLAVAKTEGQTFNESLRVIDYEHFPAQTLLPPSSIKVTRVDLKKSGNRIAYIRGAGDAIPAALRNMGYEVWEMSDDEVTSENLQTVDAMVFGIRAFNTNEAIGDVIDEILEYVKSGGAVVVQYNTTFDMNRSGYAPYGLNISRSRVTEEDARVTVVNPDHPVLNTPNKITDRDFDGWVQERGLYFPDTWEKAFEPILSMHDGGEDPLQGSLLVARYGEGYYVYTGLSFFRQLPEGVPGAYRLFANLVSLGKLEKATNNRTQKRNGK